MQQDAKLLAFQDTQKHCQKSHFYKDFQQENPVKIKALKRENLRKLFECFRKPKKSSEKKNL